MGLDMYLEGRYYVGAEYDFNNVSGTCSVKKNGKKLPFKAKDISSVTIRIGCWRKANAIHKFFVDFVQNGEDDCKDYWVSSKDIQNLKQRCIDVLADKSKAEELLPSQEEFFFGGTDYDEWYYESLKDTIEICDKALKKIEDGFDIYYSSSW